MPLPKDSWYGRLVALVLIGLDTVIGVCPPASSAGVALASLRSAAADLKRFGQRTARVTGDGRYGLT